MTNLPYNSTQFCIRWLLEECTLRTTLSLNLYVKIGRPTLTVTVGYVIIQLMSLMTSFGALSARLVGTTSSGPRNILIGPGRRVSRSRVFAKHVYSACSQSKNT